ncbi:GNAT family N-acetyltransferase [Afifella sp. YEN Y35]|uniref:GNAT family N-acetyltransferase n=1 Tax=Afifella sp. YEN Y35 TaxID=3388337 RepID=UPI0039DF410E
MTAYIRKLWPYEAALFSEHLCRLGPEARRMRFAGPVNDARIKNYVREAWDLDTTILGYFVNGVIRGSAELHPLTKEWTGKAEAAFAIEEAWQGRGVGRALLARTFTLARNRGFRQLHLFCLQENRRMLKLARELGARLTYDEGEVDALLEPPLANPFSWYGEALDDAESAFQATLSLLQPKPAGVAA